MLILFKLRNILFGAFIIFSFLIPSKEGIFSQTLDLSFPLRLERGTGELSLPVCSWQPSVQQRSNLDFNTTPSVSPPYRGRLSGGLFECSLDPPDWICVNAADSLRPDSTLRKPIDKKFRMKKSPWAAVGFSALLPGAGQFYNKSYWKIPVILGIVGYLGYEFFDNNKKYRDYRDRYSATQTTENPAGDPNLKTLREFYFDQRNDFVWYFAIVYVINLVDAYVDAHLFDFDVSEDKLTRFGTTDKEYKVIVKIKF